MARDHGRVLSKIWQDKEFRALPRTAQALYIQLLSQPNVNNAGILPLMLSKWAKGCDELTSEALMRDLAVLVDSAFIVVDTDSEEVLIRSFMRHDPGMKHPYIFKNALKMAEAAEGESIRRALGAELRRIRNADARRIAEILDPSEPDDVPAEDRFETVSNAEVNPSECHSDPIETLSESEMAFETHPDPGVVVGVVAEAETPVVGYVGGVAHAGARDADAREEPPTQKIPQPAPSIAAPEPSRFCPRHPAGSPEPCRACQAARQTFDLQQAAKAAARREADAAERQRSVEVRLAAIAACPMCDHDGRIDGWVCHHDPARMPKPGRASAALRQAQCGLCDADGHRHDDGTPCDHKAALAERESA